jgi:DHA2 family multidrug resistance protein-like MFS transporter
MDSTPPPGGAAQAGRREWIGLAVLALPTLMVALDIGSLFLALPHLSADLNPSSAEQLWIADIYGFLLAGFLVTMGSLGDRIGRRRLLMIGGIAFGVCSVLAAYSSSPAMLIISRGLLGIAGATLMPSTLALIRNMFPDPRQMGRAISLWATCQFAGAALGPVIGGLLVQYFWWGSVFLLGLPVMILMLVLAPRLLPEHRPPDAGRLDLVSVVLSLAAILPIIYGIKELATGGLDTPAVPILALVAGLAVGYAFVRRQVVLDDPLLDLGLFGQRTLSVTLTAMLLASSAMAGTFMLIGQYVQGVLGFSAAESGLLLAPTGLAIAAGSMLAPTLVKRMRPTTAMTGGLVLAALGFLMVAQVRSTGGIVLAVVGIAIVHLGAAPLFALGTGMVVGSVPPERAGSAASASETSSHFGSTLGMALLGTVGTALYRSQMSGGALDGVPPDIAESARQTLGGATSAAERLAAGPAADLLDQARDAFTGGLNTAALIGTVLCAALAVLVGLTTRAPKPADESTGDAKAPVPESALDSGS